MIGNFIADHIRGNKYEMYSKEIQQGIFLHREIDTFTDAHPIVRKSKRRLHERYGHYDGVIIDIFYDHFLARNWDNYSTIPLEVYTQSVYNLFEKESDNLPEKSQQFIKYMIEYDILFNYKLEEGIQQVLNGMNSRTKGKSQMNLAIEDLQLYNKELEEDFTIFFEDLRNFCNQKLLEISQTTL
ncbi:MULTISPECIES: ACP phosphodiesterase [Tenacibaculum]|uniref:acyl carrier protein phosphodiesterase n=1 Tax=Tenacibaculum TaxID=104267 RepID=UPI001F0AEDAF|nr:MULTISPECIES: acyl carrier protein phosphodiesterase [Tenacibaculum]MCH3883285.1 acyl carrier protein phosphodiesterase [Tenacibaculum aquimarinum]MCH3884789.1 acyl carrier protein phosphodiesterase [Tenacibaculum aquimarinum]MDO6600359.1 acyl carrier protein phosphodiesterase [Tenacibaculum sp. 1_MG-2023]